MPLRPQTLYPAHAQQHPAVNGGNVAILSADNPRYPAQFQGEQALHDELERLGLDYEVTKGKYGAPERSFIVTNPDLSTVLDLGRRFGQESVAYSENGRHQLHFVNGPQAGMATAPASEYQWNEQEPQDNYTAVPSPNGEPWGYFTWNIDFNSPLVPSSPTPMTPKQVAPMAKSEDSLLVSIRKALEALGELRTRELAKAEPPRPGPGVAVAPGVRIKPEVAAALANVKRRQVPAASPAAPASTPAASTAPAPVPKFTQAPATASMSGRASVLGMKKGELEKGTLESKLGTGKKDHIQAQLPVGTNMPMEKGEDIGSAVAMTSGDIHSRLPGRSTKKSETTDREHIRRVREAEDKELASIPVRDPNQSLGPKQSGKVPSIAEEKQMGKSESTKVDPLDRDISKQKHLCKMCKVEMSPVVAALRSKKGGVCVKCESKMKKGELSYHNNEPQYPDNHWNLKGKEGYAKSPGSGGQVTRNPIGNSSNDGAASATFPMKKAEGMPVPSAPKPPQAPGAKPSMAGGMVKSSQDSDLQKPAESTEQERFMQGIRHGWRPSHGKYKGKELPTKGEAEKVLGMHKSESAHMTLHKALREQIDLKKAFGAMGGSQPKPGMKPGAPGAAPTGIPAVGKVQPKTPAEYGAAAFRPASPGAAGAPSVAQNSQPKPAPALQAPANAPAQAPKQALPIAKMRGIRGAPLSKPKV